MEELTKFEMNRMAHARAQETHLFGSPPGKSGHKNLSYAAMQNYGVKSWSDLTVHQMKSIYEYLDRHKRLPAKGEL